MNENNKEIKVSREASTTMKTCHVIFSILGFCSVAIGFFMMFIPFDDNFIIYAVSLMSAGGVCILFANLFLALRQIVKASELYNAINEEKYNIISITEEEE